MSERQDYDVTQSLAEAVVATGGAGPSSPGTPRYDLGEEIARGGMGAVYRATDTVLRREVAVKVLQEKFAAGSAAARRFADEARITSQLQHPAIPPVHDLGTLPDGRPFLAMKLIRGDTLDELLRARPDPAHDRGRFVSAFEQVCQAVAYAHAHGVVHRDLKPSNVMVGAFGEVQVMDWGIAKVIAVGAGERPAPVARSAGGSEPISAAPDGDPNRTTDHRVAEQSTDARTVAGQALGTPTYMPPEQARGDVELIDRRSDVFALGGVLCVILTAGPTYSGRSAVEVVHKAAAGETGDALARLGACGADAELVAVATRCLAADPGGRPADAGEVARLVADYRAGVERRLREAERASAEAAVRAAEERKRRRVRRALLATVSLLVLGGAGFAWWADRQATAQGLREAQNRTEQARLEGEKLRAEGEAERSQGEIDKRVRGAQESGAAFLAQAEAALKEGDAARAAAAVGEVETRVREGAADLAPRLRVCQVDLKLLRELDRINDTRWTPPGDFAAALRAWPVAFREYGIVPGTTPVAEAADRINTSHLREHLLLTLDQWGTLDRTLPSLPILERADPDPWRTRVRRGVRERDAPEVARLVADPVADAQPTHFAVFLGGLEPIGFERRVDVLTSAQRRRPTDFPVLITLADINRGSDAVQRQARVRWALAAATARPASTVAWLLLADTLDEVGDVRGAISAYEAAIRVAPNSGRAWANLGLTYRESGDPVRGLECVLRATRLDPAYVPGWGALGGTLVKKRDVPGAIAAFREMVRLDPQSATGNNNLGRLLFASGDPDGALAAFREVIRIEPKDADAQNNVGVLLAKKGRVKDALPHFEAAAAIEPENPGYRKNVEAMKRRLGDAALPLAPPPREVKRP